MKRVALFVVLTGMLLAPVWGATPVQACENCTCQGEGTGQVSQVIQAVTGSGKISPTVEAVVGSSGPMTTVSKLARAVSRRLGASGLFGISAAIYWR